MKSRDFLFRGGKPLFFLYDEKSKGFTKREKVKEQIWRIVEYTLFKPSPKLLSPWRVLLLRAFGAKIGTGCYISNRATFVHPWNITIGNYSGIDDYVFIKGDVSIQIGNYVSIGNFAKLLPSGHDIRSRNFRHCGKPIKISNGVFIGANSFVGPGVEIGEMSVVGSGTHLYKSVPANTVAVVKQVYSFTQRLPEDEYEKFVYE